MKTALSTFFVTALLLCSPAGAAEAEAGLQDRIRQLDHDVFESFNRCSDPQQLQKHASYFDQAVEFYHDTGGVTWNRETMLGNTQQHACGRYTRQLVTDSLRVYPVHGFGAISQGQHRFCDTHTGRCEGLADFTMVWQQHDDQWLITRVLSYGHRPANAPATPPAN
jgi:hypothetical protein